MSESRFEALFQAAPSPFLIVTPPDFTIIAVNDEYLRATMTERSAILGRGLFEVFPADPDDPAQGAVNLRKSLERVIAERRTDDMPITFYPIPRPPEFGGGFEERYWSPRNAPVLDSGGNVSFIIHHVVDVTRRVRAEAALQASERRFRALATATSDVIYRVNADWSQLISVEGKNFLPDTTEPYGAWLERYVPEDERWRVLAAIRQAIDGKRPYESENRVFLRDGTEGWSSSRAVPVFDDAGEIVEWFGAATDITERRRAEAALRESELRLREAVRDRDALLQEVHHRVKNNLQVITSLLEMQARQAGDSRESSSLAEAGHRIAAISAIHELLYQSGTFSEVNLSSYGRRLVRHIASLYDRDSRIDAAIEGDDVTIDLARAVPLGLLLNELVSNAYKHAFEGRMDGVLRVAFDRDNGYIRMHVTDNGAGLAVNGADPAPSTLGLQLVRMLAKQLSGTVTFDSGDGTRVDVRVPAKADAG